MFRIQLIALCFLSTASVTFMLCEIVSIMRRKSYKCTQCGCIYDDNMARCPECGLIKSAAISSDEERARLQREADMEALNKTSYKGDLSDTFEDDAEMEGDLTENVETILEAVKAKDDTRRENF